MNDEISCFIKNNFVLSKVRLIKVLSKLIHKMFNFAVKLGSNQFFDWIKRESGENPELFPQL